ncbi:MAG: phosphoribosylformylglycinamidine cyclo-ligase, partial [Acidobacteriota bacterium]|nr:phosphoribosylformylglycinamidine cyclo-ligase [Acidobacteriota bacterium]
RSYLKLLWPFVKAHRLLGMAHITGGGLTDNIPRVLPESLDAVIDTKSWEIPALFRFLMAKGGLDISDARQALNLGVGMVLIVAESESETVLAELRAAGEAAWILGGLAPGTGKVQYR